LRNCRLSLFFHSQKQTGANIRSTEFNELLSHPHGNRAQIWIVGTGEQVNHIINGMYFKEMYVKEMTADRSQFSPLLPVPFAPGKYMSVLLR